MKESLREPLHYRDWLSFDLPDLHDADDWDDTFAYGDVRVRVGDEPEVSVLVHVICPGAMQDHAEQTPWEVVP